MAKTITAFCAAEQALTSQKLEINTYGEIVVTCECGRFIKFPNTTKPEELAGLLEEHQAANEGQLPIEVIEKKEQEFIDAVNA